MKTNVLLKQLSILSVLFTQTYYIAVSGAYTYREVLKKAGFIWNGYGIKKAWVKKIPSQEYPKICVFLHQYRLVGKQISPKNIE